MLLTVLLLLAGIALVLFGADRLTDGAVGLARRLRVTELAIGLTVVAFGTSLPEFATCLTATLKGSSGIAVGNIAGSNIFNVLAIVGCSALVTPIIISRSTVRKDIPFALLATLALTVAAMDSMVEHDGTPDRLSRTDGLLMLGLFAVFMVYTYSRARIASAGEKAVDHAAVPHMSGGRMAACMLLGLAALAAGGYLFTDAASEIARRLGVSETVIGLTIVAFGTSLPELATSVVAARKGSSSVAIGNVVGSNIFNIFFVMGFCSAISPLPTDGLSYTDMGLMLLSVLMLWFFSYTKRMIERWEGGVMVTVYIIYLAYLIQNAA